MPSSPDRPDWETDTVPTPRVRPDGRLGSETLEMPAVRSDAGRAGRPAGGTRPRAPRSAAPPRRRRRRPLRLALLALALVAAASLGVLAGRVLPDATREAAPPTPASEGGGGDAVLDVQWSSVDPVGGSGFRQVDATTWRTQSYRTAQFGNLKPGVGLLADVGSARPVSAVSVDVAPVGVVLELRAGDTPSDDPGDYTVVAEATDATGPTTLDASDAGEHRYWMVWVSELGPRENGYVAELSDPRLEG